MGSRSEYPDHQVVSGQTVSNVDFSLLVRAKERERAAIREIRDHQHYAFLMTLLGAGTVVFFGGMFLTFSLLYMLNLVIRVID